MSNPRRIAGIVLIILLTSLIQWPQATTITPQDQTISITDTHDDLFITETGIGIDSQLCHILDPTMDIRSYLVFRGVEINFWEPLKNATLRFRTTANLDFDANSTVTIYGMKYSDLQDEGILNPSWVLSVPITSASVTRNTSQFYGQTWHEVDVTAIVEELIRSYDWDGDGIDGTETGDAIGFIILGAEGYDTRWFIDYLYGTPSLASQLVIHWNHEPPPPAEGMTFIEIHGENYSIWQYEELGAIELIYTSKTAGYYHNSTTGLDGWVNWKTGDSFSWSDWGAMETIERLDPWTFIIGDNHSTKIYYSDDEFSAGSIRVSEPNKQYPDLDGFLGNMGSIHLDQNDSQTLHVLWTSPTPWQNAVYNVVYSNFTVLENGSLQWAPDFVNITTVGSTQSQPDLYCEKDGTLHIAWHGSQATSYDQVWYMRRYSNGTWGSQVRLSEGDVFHSWGPDVIANEETGEALVAWTYHKADPKDIKWRIIFPNNTAGTEKTISSARFPSMVNDRDNNVAHMAHQDTSGNPRVYYRFKSIDDISSWSAVQSVSPGGEKHFYPSISVDEDNDTLAVIWWDDWISKTAYNYFQIGSAPVAGRNSIANTPFLYVSNPDYFSRHVDWTVFMIFNENGTNVANTTSLGDAEDWIDVYDPDPEDPDPGGEWSEGPGGETGAFTRFRMRLWFMLIGFGCLFGPVLFFAWRRPSGYYIICGAIVMLIGIGLLLSIGQV